MAKQHDDEAPDSGAKASSFGPGTVLRGIRRHSIISFLFLLATVGAALRRILAPLPKFTAYVVFDITSQSLKLAGEPTAKLDSYHQGQAALVTSSKILGRALNTELPIKGGLSTAVDSNKPEDPESEGSTTTHGPLVCDNAFLRDIPGPQRLQWLQSKIKADFRASPEYLRVSIEGDEPEGDAGSR